MIIWLLYQLLSFLSMIRTSIALVNLSKFHWDQPSSKSSLTANMGEQSEHTLSSSTQLPCYEYIFIIANKYHFLTNLILLCHCDSRKNANKDFSSVYQQEKWEKYVRFTAKLHSILFSIVRNTYQHFPGAESHSSYYFMFPAQAGIFCLHI